MSKFALIATAAATILATPLMSSHADAGGCGGYGGFNGYGGGSYSSRSSYQSYSSSSYAAQPRRVAKPKARLAIAKPVRATGLKSKSVASSSAPVVFIPNNSSGTSTVVAKATEDQSAAQIKVAAIETPENTQEAANEAATTAEPAKTETETVTTDVPNDTKRVCRRYSPATGGMVEVACE